MGCERKQPIGRDFRDRLRFGEEEGRVGRASTPDVVSNVHQDDRPVGEIALRSVFRNTYAITLAGGSTWLFRMPLFAVTFHGESQDGRQVWVRVGPRKTRWNILLDASLDHLHLLAALAFIHREWWCYS